MGTNALILRRRGANYTMDNLPKFVQMFGGACLRLKIVYEGAEPEYYCDGGCWGVGVKIINGKLFSTHSFVKTVDGIEMKPVTEKIWRETNGEYAPKNP